jgi:hypothetical protein
VKVTAAIAFAFALGAAGSGCARRLPPRASAMDAQRANATLAELEAGRKLVIAKCGSRCHQPPMPRDHTALEWPKAMDEMSPRAGIDGDQRRAIERYLVAMTNR